MRWQTMNHERKHADEVSVPLGQRLAGSTEPRLVPAVPAAWIVGAYPSGRAKEPSQRWARSSVTRQPLAYFCCPLPSDLHGMSQKNRKTSLPWKLLTVSKG